MNTNVKESTDMSNIEDDIIALAASAAQMAYDDGEGVIPEDADEVSEGGAFTIDLLIPTGVESGDGRKLLEGSLSTRELPIPLLWQPKTGTGHDGSFIIGRIDSCDVGPGGITNAQGVFDTGPYGREAERLVRNGMLRGISADLDMFETVGDEEMAQMAAESGEDLSSKLFIKTARTMAATLLPKPAFQECTIRLNDSLEDLPVVDGIYEVDTDYDDSGDALTAALIASAIPIAPPKTWFNDPLLKRETPLTVDENGQVFGHIATWVTDHIGNYGVRPPRSRSNYAYFHTGLVRTDDSTDVAVGQLTLAGGHAALDKSAHEAVAHYDDTSSAIADVHAGEDAYGIWVAGALRPGVTAEQVRVLRASSPSGDWRPINGKLELVAVLHVNVPGFPIARACVASGSVTALVAAGASSLHRLKYPKAEDTGEISSRLQSLENTILSEKRDLALKRMQGERDARRLALVASAEALKEKFAPELNARAEAKAELASIAEELKQRVFAFHTPPKYVEAKHPRNDHGQWRKVLGRLSELLGDDDKSGATQAVKKAADAEDVGDQDEVNSASREAKVSLNEALKREIDPKIKGKIVEAIKQVSDAADKDHKTPSIPGADSAPVTALEAGIAVVVEKAIDELIGENVDPKAMADRAFNKLKHYVDDKAISPEALMKLIADKIQKKFTPGIAQ